MTLIYYVGQDVGLTATVTDDTGNPASGPVAASLAVTDPTGATSTPAVSSAGSGAYSAVVVGVSTPGVWLYRWTATGTGVGFASEGQFQVRPVGAEQLVDLASVKAHLNIPTTDTRQDDELQGFILAAADIARDHCGPLVPETHTEFFSGGVPTISPDWLPVSKVLSCTEYYGLAAFTLTEQPLGSQMNAFAFTVDYATGEISRRTIGGESALFAFGSKNVRLVYTAGIGTVPYSVRLGVLELVRHLWQLTQQGGRPRFGGSGYDGDVQAIPTGFALPTRVVELWQGYRRPPGIA
ncbi:hypothetical protein P3T36_002995 [Kitasatospora sp. MAP12-15]|uniref:head-tail connector protein n=1 Tax=unclassified Kitasatospora TaxID=2633591 RepID=UPI0024762531|nr:head-tail connector protein [Kitasatospora sp. MAP12-44]MDH6108864.1 hypothetical protein [Kitasatospora sp. MAP12-44]